MFGLKYDTLLTKCFSIHFNMCFLKEHTNFKGNLFKIFLTIENIALSNVNWSISTKWIYVVQSSRSLLNIVDFIEFMKAILVEEVTLHYLIRCRHSPACTILFSLHKNFVCVFYRILRPSWFIAIGHAIPSGFIFLIKIYSTT